MMTKTILMAWIGCCLFIAAQAQCLSGDCTNGYGKYKYKNEDVYEGNAKNGYASGKGIMNYSSGDKYEGDWVNGRWNGKGKYTWKDGRTYEGDVKDGYFEGKGLFKNTEGNQYDGLWLLGKMHGYGVYTYKDGRKYEGNYEKDAKSGKGKFTYTSGGYYDGDWKEDKLNGYGLRKYTDTTYYEGYFVADKFQGKGKTKLSNGSFFEGEYVDGKANGPGKITVKNGDIYEGVYTNDTLSGQVKITYKNGDVYNGGFIKSARAGNGTLVKKDNSQYVGSWVNGLYDGNGVLTYPNGDRFEGAFAAGSPKEGRFYKSNKLVYDGKLDSRTSVSYGNNFLSTDGKWISRTYFSDASIFQIVYPKDTLFIGTANDKSYIYNIDDLKPVEGFYLTPNGKLALGKTQYNNSITVSQVLSLKPHVSMTDYAKGRAFFAYKKYAASLPYFTKAVEAGSKEDSVLLFRGIAYYNTYKNDSALVDFQQAVKKMPNNKDAVQWLANIALIKKDTAAAYNSLNSYLKNNGKDTTVLWKRGNLYYTQKNYEKAVDDYTKVIQLSKSKVDNAYYYRGICYEKLGKNQEACADYKKAKELGNTYVLASKITALCGTP